MHRRIRCNELVLPTEVADDGVLLGQIVFLTLRCVTVIEAVWGPAASVEQHRRHGRKSEKWSVMLAQQPRLWFALRFVRRHVHHGERRDDAAGSAPASRRCPTEETTTGLT